MGVAEAYHRVVVICAFDLLVRRSKTKLGNLNKSEHECGRITVHLICHFKL